MRDVEPGTVDDNAAVNVILGHAGFMDVVGLQDQLAQGHFARPGIVGLDGVLRQGLADQQRGVPKRTPAAGTGFGISPGAAVHVAARLRGRAGVVVEQRENVAGVGAPVRE